MVALGAFIGAARNVDFPLIQAGLADLFASRPKLVGVNQACLQQGFDIGQAAIASVAAR
jgi:hypothetical protein